MNYTDLKIDFRKPKIWRRPSIEKLPKEGKIYNQTVKEQKEFEDFKSKAKEEIVGQFNKSIECSKDLTQLNKGISDICDFYGKAVIVSEDVDDKFLLSKTNQNTLNKKLQGWCKNLVYNIPEIIESKPYGDLVGKFKDIPAFVCMAGPSLKNNRELLKQVKSKALVIAVDTSLRPLLDAGIIPDICVTHDANPNGCKFFLSAEHELNKLNVQLNDKKDEELALVYLSLQQDKERLNFKYDTLGLFVNYCHPLTLLSWNGREKRFYGVLDPSLPVYDTMAACSNYKMEEGKLTPENKGRVVGGSSVGHVATYVTVALGCNPISLLGLDLSYPGGKTYIEGASNQKDVSKQKLIEVNSLSGERVKTNASMLSYKMVFENTFPVMLAQMPHLELYNCTEDDKGNPAGILEVGCEPKKLSWVIENYCNNGKVVNLNG